MSKIYLVRHGETIMNREIILQGAVVDSSLTDKGVESTMKLKKWLDSQNIIFDHVYTSPMQRTKTTAEILTNNKEYIVLDNLNEYNFGPREGLPIPRKNPTEMTQYDTTGGEGKLKTAKRMYDVMLEIGKSGENCLAVSHGVSCGLLDLYVNNDMDNNICPMMSNCSAYIYRYQNGVLELLDKIDNNDM